MKCLNCDIELTSNKKYCSNSCKKKYLYKKKLFNKECIICKKTFTGTAGMKCCSDSCSIKAQRLYKKSCPVCGKRFSARGNGVYCSDMCYRTANSKTKGLTIGVCRVCKSPYRFKKDSNSIVCSSECSSNLFSVLIDETLMEIFATTDKKAIKILLENNVCFTDDELLKDNFQEKGEITNG